MLPVVAAGLVLAACSGEDESPAASSEPPATTAPTTSTATSLAATTSSTTTTTTTEPPAELAGLAYHVVVEAVEFPIILVPWTAEASLVGLRDGRIHSFDGAALSTEPLVDLEAATDGERGLLGLEVADEETIYVHYSDPAGDTVVSEIGLADGAERVLTTIAQPAANHNGGTVQFGPDGMLYVGLGDGGGAGDPFGNAQDTGTLLGGIVRLDPDSGDTELWSHGLRNPYRFWFDADLFYVADVGQDAYEEVDVVAFGPDGYDFGWPITEGMHCFSPRTGCETGDITLPVLEVEHGVSGTCSIIGGVVYRGSSIPELTGHYLYSDHCGGWLRSFRFAEPGVTDERDWTADVGALDGVVSFGVDHTGEVYVLTRDAIRRIDPVR